MELHFTKQDSHPRLIFSKEEIENLKGKITTDSTLNQNLCKLEEHAQTLLLQPLFSEKYANAVYSQHGNYYDIGAQLIDFSETLGFLYQLTGNDKYAGKLREAMVHYSTFAVWTGPSNKDRKIPWHSDLSTTRILYGFALGYDCINETLTPEEEQIISDALLNKGIMPLLEDWVFPNTRIHALDSMGHNWWAVCVGFAGIGLAAIYEKVPQADKWMQAVVEALRSFCSYSGELLLNKPANFDNEGMFYESARYFNYGIGELMRFILTYKRCFNNHRLVTFPQLEKAGEALISMTYPTNDNEKPFTVVNFGDCFLSENISLLPMLLIIDQGGAALRIYYQSVKRKWDLFDFIYYDILWSKSDIGELELPKSHYYPNTGYLFLRDSWKPNATLLGIRCGFTWNHAHDDAGSFVIFDNGLPIIADSGTIAYDNSLYRNYYINAQAHNIVLVNNRGQVRENISCGSKFTGTLSHFMESDWVKYVLADATGPMADQCNRNYRNFLWIGEDIFITIDDLRTYKPSKFEMLLHFVGKGTVSGDEIVIKNNASHLNIKVLYPQDCQITERQGFHEFMPEAGKKISSISYFKVSDEVPVQPYFAVSSEELTQVQKFFTLFLLNNTQSQVTSQQLQGPDFIGTRLIRNNQQIDIYFNLEADGRRMHVNSNNNLNGFETDAYILVVDYENNIPHRYLMVYGSYLRKDGLSQYESYKKDFLFGTFDKFID